VYRALQLPPGPSPFLLASRGAPLLLLIRCFSLDWFVDGF
jgi:hypothetical protein